MGVMDAIRAVRASRLFQRLMRIFQFLSAVISLAMFSARLYKILRLAHRASHSNSAVEGILTAATLYTLIATIIQLLLKKKGAPMALRWLLIVLDLLFMAAFIVVSVLTRPNGGSSGPCRGSRYKSVIPKGSNCNLPWGVFILSIVSTLLHFLTAVFNEVRRNRQQGKGDNDYMHSNPAGNEMEQNRY